MAALLLVMIVYRFTSQERGEMAFLAIDSAMLTDAILASPQEVQVIYPQDATKWYVKLYNDSISIFPGEPQPNASSFYTYYFIGRRDMTIRDKLVNLPLFLIKQKAEFTISNAPLLIEPPAVSEEKDAQEKAAEE